MDEKIEIMKRILELAETTLEGLEHVSRRVQEGYFQDTTELFTDVVASIHEMEKALQPFLPELEENDLEKKNKELLQALRFLLAAYEGDQDVRPVEVLQFTLLPRYRAWQEELRGALGPYTAS